jgi:osmotically inducible protein OsmC
MIRKAKAVWRGTGRAGNGDLSTDSGVLSKTPYSFRTRFENEKGTNPEELIAAAHAGCFTMALAFQLQSAGYTPTELSTEAAVSLDADGSGFRITRSALTLLETLGIDLPRPHFERIHALRDAGIVLLASVTNVVEARASGRARTGVSGERRTMTQLSCCYQRCRELGASSEDR